MSYPVIKEGRKRPIRKMARMLCKKLAKFDPEIKACESSTSVYIYLKGCEVCSKIRVSDHVGYPLRKKHFDLRSDCCTYSRRRIYRFQDMNLLVKRLLE